MGKPIWYRPMPSPPKTLDKRIQFRAPMTLTTMALVVKISVPFKNLLSFFTGV
jgi:hypothetical protein